MSWSEQQTARLVRDRAYIRRTNMTFGYLELKQSIDAVEREIENATNSLAINQIVLTALNKELTKHKPPELTG